jgi:hypothetical protein
MKEVATDLETIFLADKETGNLIASNNPSDN